LCAILEKQKRSNMKFLKFTVSIQILLFSLSFYSQNVTGKKFVAYLGNKCGDNFSSFFYKEFDFKKDSVTVTDYQLHDNEMFYKRLYVVPKEYSYKIEYNNIIIKDSEFEEIKINDDVLVTKLVKFKLVNENAITRISYYGKSGGKDGSYINLEITKDSIKYSDGAEYPKYQNNYKEKTASDLWENLTRDFKISDFDKIKSTESVQYRDDYDKTITIEIDGFKHQILNGIIDKKNDQEIFLFVENIEKLIKK
jgi:hypothetical protein